MMAGEGGGEWHQCSFRQPDGLSNHDISVMRPLKEEEEGSNDCVCSLHVIRIHCRDFDDWNAD